MAKKILAVVLAVAMALSAMAVTVFADQQIPLYKAGTNDSTTMTIEFTIPVYAQYNWLVQYDGIELVLPTNLGPGMRDFDINWKAIVNGQSYAIQPLLKGGSTGAENGNVNTATADWSSETAGVYKQYIYFGVLPHDYINTSVWTTIPQSQSFGGINAIKIVAEISVDSNWGHTWRIGSGTWPEHLNQWGVNVGWGTGKAFLDAVYGGLCYAQAITYNQETQTYDKVPNSISYLSSWNSAVNGENVNNAKTYKFVSGDTTTYFGGLDSDGKWAFDVEAAKLNNTLTWDHTIANRGLVMGAEKVQLVVKLNKAINGVATYTLFGKTQSAAVLDSTGSYQDLWFKYDSSRRLIDSVQVNGSVNELVFDVPAEYLVDSRYGAYNDEFAILETVELLDTTVMQDRVTIKAGLGDKNSLGNISWDKGSKSNPAYNLPWACYAGAPVMYAEAGSVFPYTVNGTVVEHGAEATEMYLNIVETPAEPKETETVDQATEGGEGEGDNVDVGDTEGKDVNVGDTEPEQNPTTGVALAVVPMLVAAAAAVVCKKH